MKKFIIQVSVLQKPFKMTIKANSKWEAWEKARETIVSSISKSSIEEEESIDINNAFGGVFKDIFK